METPAWFNLKYYSSEKDPAYWASAISSRLKLQHLVYSQFRTENYRDRMEKAFQDVVHNHSENELSINEVESRSVKKGTIEQLEYYVFITQEFSSNPAPYLSVDLSQDDKTLVMDFINLVKKLREEEGISAKKRSVSDSDIARWNSHSILPCQDLILWKIVTKETLIHDELAGLVGLKGYNTGERIRKTVLPTIAEVFTPTMLSRVRNIAAKESNTNR